MKKKPILETNSKPDLILSIKSLSLFTKLFLIFDKEFKDSNIPIWIIFFILFVNGLINLYFSLFYELPYTQSLIVTLFSINVDFVNKTLSFVLGFSFIYLSFQILNHKSLAWYISFLVLFLSIISQLIRIESWISFIVPLFGLIILVLNKDKFINRFEMNSLENNIIIVLLVLMISILYGIIGFLFLGTENFGRSYSFIDSLTNTITTILFFEGNSITTLTMFAEWFIFSLHLTGFLFVFFLLFSLFRPLYYNLVIYPNDLIIAEKILKIHGNSAIDFFKLWPDKSLFFSSKKTSFIAYRVKYSCAICLGDPSGPPDEIENILSEFENFCNVNGWKIGFHHVKSDFLEIYKKMDFNYFKIGEEGTINIEKFVNSTFNNSDFKRTTNKLTKRGYKIEIHSPPHNLNIINDVKKVSDEWLSTGRRERSFTLGRFDVNYVQKCELILLKDPNNSIIAFLNRIPSYISKEVTCDMMRQKKDLVNGAMDFIFASYIKILYQEGYKTVSVGLSPFSGINELEHSPLIEKLLEELFEHFNNLFSFKGLKNYKDKFEPDWDDRFFVYNGNYLSLFKNVLSFVRISEK